MSYRYTSFKKGDLVQWALGVGPGAATNYLGELKKKDLGIIIDVNPRNVYDSESCDIINSSGIVQTLESKFLSKVENKTV